MFLKTVEALGDPMDIWGSWPEYGVLPADDFVERRGLEGSWCLLEVVG